VSSDGGLPVDPALPQLRSALDESVMAAHFADVLRGHGAGVEACCVERVKYRPGRNCTLSYRLQPARPGQRPPPRATRGRAPVQRRRGRCAPRARCRDGLGAFASRPGAAPPAGAGHADLVVAERRQADCTGRAGRCAARLREQWLPPVLSVLGAPARRVLTGHELDGRAVRARAPSHRTCRPAVARRARRSRSAVYAKSSREPDGASAHGHAAHAAVVGGLAAAGRLNTPRALLWQPLTGLHWQQGVPGRALLDLPARASRGARAVARRAARRAARASPVALTRSITPEVMRSRLAEVQALLGDALPPSQPICQSPRADWPGGHALGAGQQLATLHGDLHPRNVMAEGRGTCR
jgi:hypothetical protein